MADQFDVLMSGSCSIVKKKSFDDAGADAYGQPDQSFITVIASWPCRRSTMQGGNEYKVGKEFAKNTFKFFMRPPTQDDAHAAFELTTHHWLKQGSTYYNITGVNDPSALGHHLEILAEQVIP